MSLENKGSMGTTVKVTREPDRSGNWVCDGVADDVQINAAVDYVESLGGGKIFLGEGTYTLTAPILIVDDDVTIIGCGKNTVLNMTAAGTIVIHIQGTEGTPIERATLRDFRILGPGGSGGGVGIYVEYSSHNLIDGIEIKSVESVGIDLETNSYDNMVSNCRVESTPSYGFFSEAGGARNQFVNCEATLCLRGFMSTNSGTAYTNCYAHHNTESGFRTTGTDMSYTSCQAGYNHDFGFRIDDGAFVNVITGCVSARNGNDEIATVGGWNIYILGDDNTVTGCSINHSYQGGTRLGIGVVIDGGKRNVVCGNNIYENPVNPVGGTTGHGVWIAGSDADDNVVVDNSIYLNDGNGVIIAANEDRNVVKNNKFVSNSDGPISDSGTDTKLAVAPFQFTEPIGTAAIVVASPTGIDVDADTEGALVWGQIPEEVQQVVRLKVWAVATDAPIGAGGQMHGDFTFNAGASNAAYNEAGKSWTLANFDGEEADYVANDVVHWVIEDGDVSNELANLVEGDSFELLVMHEAGADPDGATDALFRVLEVEYV